LSDALVVAFAPGYCAGLPAHGGSATVMAEDDLAQAARELSGLTASAPPKCLRRLVEVVAQAVPGCAGATSTLWQHGELAISTATHPDLADLGASGAWVIMVE
jgi:hypothetical protein